MTIASCPLSKYTVNLVDVLSANGLSLRPWMAMSWLQLTHIDGVMYTEVVGQVAQLVGIGASASENGEWPKPPRRELALNGAW